MIEKYIGLLEISEQDLIASKILYDKELYPQSLFYLQQSAEKLTKYIGLTNNVITKNDLLKSIGHNSIKIYKKSMGNFKTRFPELVSIDIDKAFQEIKELADKKPINEVVNTLLYQIDSILVDQHTLPFDIHKMETASDYCKILSQVDSENEI